MGIDSGYFKIQNDIAESLALTNLSEYENRALWFIFRKTWGWNKDSDSISIGQFEKATGIDRGNIYPALKRLAEKKIVIIDNHSYINQYKVNLNVADWIGKTKKRIVATNTSVPTNNIIASDNKVLSSKTTKPLLIDTPTINIKTPIQNTLNKNITLLENPVSDKVHTQTSIQKLVAYYKSLYKAKFNQDPTIGSASWGKWGRLLKTKLEQGYSLEEIATLLLAFSKSKDSDADRLGFDLGIFFSDSIFNKIRAIQAKAPKVEGGKYAKY